MPESIQHWLDRNRPPRVQITYDVETAGAIQKKELPLVMGILADLSGKPVTPLPKLKDRKFIEIDRDNFKDILQSTSPHLELLVPNRLAKDPSKLKVELTFKDMDDFGPLAIIRQCQPLAALWEARGRLNDLLAKLDGNDDLELALRRVARDPAGMKQIEAETVQATKDQAARSAALAQAAAADATTWATLAQTAAAEAAQAAAEQAAKAAADAAAKPDQDALAKSVIDAKDAAAEAAKAAVEAADAAAKAADAAQAVKAAAGPDAAKAAKANADAAAKAAQDAAATAQAKAKAAQDAADAAAKSDAAAAEKRQAALSAAEKPADGGSNA
ncbi:MAG TPA: type VI secretion system contractile sheath small subunit [Bryobacteraceae bacterium]|nr:type VI secretion system contractile sheath small subunit [Bryobacteraceae bacterium]